jgi:hypothetical protein
MQFVLPLVMNLSVLWADWEEMDCKKIQQDLQVIMMFIEMTCRPRPTGVPIPSPTPSYVRHRGRDE